MLLFIYYLHHLVHISYYLVQSKRSHMLCPCIYCHYLPEQYMSCKKERMPIIPSGYESLQQYDIMAKLHPPRFLWYLCHKIPHILEGLVNSSQKINICWMSEGIHDKEF